MNRLNVARLRAVSIAAGSATIVAAIGATITDLGPWYHSLVRPSWQPPDAAFGVVWTVIFALAAISGAVAWPRAATRQTREWTVGLFALNGFLNILWSLLFFRLRRPDWALAEVAGLWLSIALLIGYLWRVSRLASVLLAPYLAWVSIAAILNLDVVRANAPFR